MASDKSLEALLLQAVAHTAAEGNRLFVISEFFTRTSPDDRGK